MPGLEDLCRRTVEDVQDALACAVVDLKTGALWGVHHAVPSFDAAHLNAVALAAVELLRGKAARRLEETLSQLQEGQPAERLEEIFVSSVAVFHFLKLIEKNRLSWSWSRTRQRTRAWAGRPCARRFPSFWLDWRIPRNSMLEASTETHLNPKSMPAAFNSQASLNHNIRYKGAVFHVQTELDRSQGTHVASHLFLDGAVFASKRTDCEPLLGVCPDPEEKRLELRRLIRSQHVRLIEELKSGSLDELLKDLERASVRKPPSGVLAAPRQSRPEASPAKRSDHPLTLLCRNYLLEEPDIEACGVREVISNILFSAHSAEHFPSDVERIDFLMTCTDLLLELDIPQMGGGSVSSGMPVATLALQGQSGHQFMSILYKDYIYVLALCTTEHVRFGTGLSMLLHFTQLVKDQLAQES